MRRRRDGGVVRPRGNAVPQGRAAVLDWLGGRVDFERTPPKKPGADFGLGRMRRLLARLDAPHDAFPVVHVAGTKGKGSTVAMLSAVLSAAGHRTGRYMSPHVHSLEERISIDGRPISAAALVAVFDILIPAVEALDRAAARRGGRGPTWFEVVTAAAFLHFARSRVDLAVLETGLGGRLDATNVSRPVVSVITSVSLDHMELLGRTVGRIAGEKAGIIKRGRPVISGAAHPAARRVIADTARRRRAALLQVGRDFRVTHAASDDPLEGGAVEVTSVRDGVSEHFRLAMAGRHQADNAALVVMAARQVDAAGFAVPRQAIARGLARVRLPARIERIEDAPLVVVDAAHNVASMRSLLETLAPALATRRPRVLVFAASMDKQIEEMLAAATGCFDHVILTRYTTNTRAAPVARLVSACRAAGLPPPRVAGTPVEALEAARGVAGRGGMVCVAGSFFLASEILRPA